MHTLNLSHCSNIRDVTALKGVHTLNLSRYTRISDVNALKYSHVGLKLPNCYGCECVGRSTGFELVRMLHI